MRDHENMIRLVFTGHALLRMLCSVRCSSDDLNHIKTFKISVNFKDKDKKIFKENFIIDLNISCYFILNNEN